MSQYYSAPCPRGCGNFIDPLERCSCEPKRTQRAGALELRLVLEALCRALGELPADSLDQASFRAYSDAVDVLEPNEFRARFMAQATERNRKEMACEYVAYPECGCKDKCRYESNAVPQVAATRDMGLDRSSQRAMRLSTNGLTVEANVSLDDDGICTAHGILCCEMCRYK